MLKMEINIHDELWPQIVLTVTRESYRNGKIVQQEKKTYDLAYGKLEEMLHNHARPMVQELLDRHQRSATGVPK
jgi:hypothetical protein